MIGYPFYHGSIRKFISAFGQLFSDIKVATVDGSGNIIKASTVPIKYAGTDKTLLNDSPDRKPYSQVFPRIAFEIKQIGIDPDKKLNPNNNIGGIGVPIPYVVDMDLYILSENQHDSLQIVEQILPFFTPSLTINMKDFPIPGKSFDIPITLTAVSTSDDYEGEEDKQRRVEWTLAFSAQVPFFGSISNTQYTSNLMDFITKNYDPADPTTCSPPVVKKHVVNKNRIEKIYINEYTDKFDFDRLFDENPFNHDDVVPVNTIRILADTYRVP